MNTMLLLQATLLHVRSLTFECHHVVAAGDGTAHQ
jgi:hypothetical protein